MKLLFVPFFILVGSTTISAQNEWLISATSINPNNYYGVTVANGMIGLISSPEPTCFQS